MKRNKYIEDLGIPREKLSENMCEKTATPERLSQWKSEQAKYGFDSRCSWNLDVTFAEWIYSRLCMYLEHSKHVDLTYHTYTWDNKKVNQLEAINIIKDTAKEYLLSLNDTDYHKQDEALKKFCEVMELWGMILPAMWT